METVRPPHSTLPPGLVSLRLGIWRVVLRRRNLTLPSSSIKASWRDCVTSASEAHVFHLFADIYSLGPFLFFIAVLSNCLSGIEGTLTVWSLNKLLRVVEHGYLSKTQDVSAVVKALFIRLLLTTVITAWRWMAARTNGVLSTRVKMHFEERLLRAHLSMDLASSQKNSGSINISPMSAWDTFQSFLGTLRIISTAISQIFLITTIISSQTSSLLPLLLCMAWPVFTAMSERQSLWSHSFIAYVTSEPYRRLKTLYNLALNKTEVIGGGLAQYILREYCKAQKLMGDTSSEQPWELYTLTDTPWSEISSRILNDLPLIYYALECMRTGAHLSTASLATLQQICCLLSDTVRLVVQEKDNIGRNLRVLKDLYRDYGPPRSGCNDAPSLVAGVGMGIELRNVTFQYPTTENAALALRNISFSIKPSSLVVIVGANGSGKSSLVNLLAGLYEPTSGSILMDGHPTQSYYKPDLQACVALLAQRHQLFNLSVAETIGIGDPDAANDRKRIELAARLGGAYGFVHRFNAGFDEVLQPVVTSYSSDYPAEDHQLREVFDSIERQKDISGGERQRLAASRTFMRLMSGKIKLVVVDEPTSAMDPLGEFELFEKLRSYRAGKTMIFVTHRFGHLTKHADLVLCLKDGELIESGTHSELIERRGEYHRLYEIQACAFND